MPICVKPDCGHLISPGEKFCPECGTPMQLPPRPPSGVVAGTPISIGEKAIVTGNVVGGDQIKVMGDLTNITHTDETRKVKLCAVCGSHQEVVKGNDCPQCREWVCRDCFVVSLLACVSCQKAGQSRAETDYRALLVEVYQNKRVDEADRVMLRAAASRLGLTAEQVQKLEAPFRIVEESALAGADLLRLTAAEQALYTEFKVDEAYPKLQALYEQYQRRDPRLWRAYLHCLVEYDPELAQQFLESLDVDDALATGQRIELMMRRHDFMEAGKLLRAARSKFGDNPEWAPLEVELLLEEYRQGRDKMFLEAARERLKNAPEREPAYHLAAACLAQLGGERDALRKLHEQQPAGSELAYRVLRKRKWASLGPLWLVMGATEYRCKSGDVIGRQGTLAMDQMNGIGTLSRRHAQILVRGGRWNVRILASTNTSTMDGKPLSPNQFHPLAIEHRVRLSSQCEFELKTTVGQPC